MWFWLFVGAISLPIVLLLISIKIVSQERRAVVERFGKYHRYFTPGLHFIIPIIEWMGSTDIRSQTLDIPPQPVITKDNVEIKVDGIIWARPYDNQEAVYKTFYSIDNWKKAIQELAQTNLRQEFGALTLDDSLTARATISSNLETELDKLTDEWGIKVDKVEIKLIDPPEDIKRAMHQQKTAEQNRRAAKLQATGRYEAAEQDKLATIQQAEGARQAIILQAEAHKREKILSAEGEQQAIEKVAIAKAEAIRLINNSAEKHFIGNAQELKKLEVTEQSLRYNSKVILTKEGMSPQIILGNIPVGK